MPQDNTPTPEVAPILFIDIVSYWLLDMDQQMKVVCTLEGALPVLRAEHFVAPLKREANRQIARMPSVLAPIPDGLRS